MGLRVPPPLAAHASFGHRTAACRIRLSATAAPRRRRPARAMAGPLEPVLGRTSTPVAGSSRPPATLGTVPVVSPEMGTVIFAPPWAVPVAQLPVALALLVNRP